MQVCQSPVVGRLYYCLHYATEMSDALIPPDESIYVYIFEYDIDKNRWWGLMTEVR